MYKDKMRYLLTFHVSSYCFFVFAEQKRCVESEVECVLGERVRTDRCPGWPGAVGPRGPPRGAGASAPHTNDPHKKRGSWQRLSPRGAASVTSVVPHPRVVERQPSRGPPHHRPVVAWQTRIPRVTFTIPAATSSVVSVHPPPPPQQTRCVDQMVF